MSSRKVMFCSREHQEFFFDMMNRCKIKDSYCRAFFYITGIAEETRKHIEKLFDFKRSGVIPEGINGGWQTSSTMRVCRLAFNLWNGYTEEGNEEASTPYDLFCCEFAPFFMEGIRLRYLEYCGEYPLLQVVYEMEGENDDEL
jgi:hypothetical protein